MPDFEQSYPSNIILKHSFRGGLRSNEGFKSTTGDLATLTATSGKDMYITSAKINFFNNTTGLVSAISEVVLKINGTIVETAKAGTLQTSGSALGDSVLTAYEFKNMYNKVASTQIIKLEVISIDANVDVEGFFQCIEVDTGVDPTI